MRPATNVNTKDIVRKLPEWAKIDRVVNNTPIYNMGLFDNIMSWNQDNLDGEAFDYYGTTITFGELPALRDAYARGFLEIGVKKGDVATLCLPVSIENMMCLLADNLNGVISNNVSLPELRHDLKTYTIAKKSDILVTCDGYIPAFIQQIPGSGIKKIVVMSLEDYLPEDRKNYFHEDPSRLPGAFAQIFHPMVIQKCLGMLSQVPGLEIIRMQDMIEMGRKSTIELPCGPVDQDRDISYTYTSGTTGNPKCVVYKEASVNAYIEMHAGLDLGERVGERCFQIIPMTHMTGERAVGYMSWCKCRTLVPQPIYNKDAFAKDLAESKCNYVVAAASFYTNAVKQGVLGPDALAAVTRPGSGGEPATKSAVQQIDNWLRANGCNVRFSLGGGASEEGGVTLVTYFLDEKTKTNETGAPLEPFVRVKLVDDNGDPVPQGQLGHMLATSPACADRYLDNPEATAARWFTDEDGVRWGRTGDIAVQHPDGTYNILGRASDSYVDETGKRIYLFEIEESVDPADPIIEWEVTAFPAEGKHEVVGQIILRPEHTESIPELVEKFTAKYPINAVKFYPEFKLGEVTSKRDFVFLQHDYEGYLAPCDAENLYKVTYAADGTVTREKVAKADL